MEQYRKSVIRRMWALSAAVLLAAALGIYDVLIASPPIKNSEIFSFQVGFVVGIAVMAVFVLIRYGKALRSDRLLKEEYNREHDERLQFIRAKAGMPFCLITSLLMIAAGVIAGYFNTLVFWTLIAAATVQLLMGAAVKMYYLKKV